MTITDLPAVNASLNGGSATLLAAGYLLIRGGNVRGHRLCMGVAFLMSIAFLGTYLYYHAHAGSKPFPGQGAVRTVYFTILISHTLLAAAVPLLAALTMHRALLGRFDAHKAIARWTLPIWFYVSVTGVVIYWMLYRMPPGAG